MSIDNAINDLKKKLPRDIREKFDFVAVTNNGETHGMIAVTQQECEFLVACQTYLPTLLGIIDNFVNGQPPMTEKEKLFGELVGERIGIELELKNVNTCIEELRTEALAKLITLAKM